MRNFNRKLGRVIAVMLLIGLLAAPSAFAETTRVDATTSNCTFTLPNPWSVSTPVGIPAPGHVGGSVFHSSTTNGTLTFAFEGTGVDLVYAKWHNRGIAAVSVDGGAETPVDMYAPGTSDLATVLPQQVVAVASGLTDGPHTLQVRVTGTRNPASSSTLINVDAFDVTVPDPPVISTLASSPWSIGIGILAAAAVLVFSLRRRTAS
jgi:hypothetical protein